MNSYLPKGTFARRIVDELVIVVAVGLCVWIIGRYWWQLAVSFVAVGLAVGVMVFLAKRAPKTVSARVLKSVGRGLLTLTGRSSRLSRVFARHARVAEARADALAAELGETQEELRATKRAFKELQAATAEHSGS